MAKNGNGKATEEKALEGPLDNDQPSESARQAPARPKVAKEPGKVGEVVAGGLVAVGVVQRRTRRRVGESNTEVVTYTLGPRLVQVDEWEPASYHQIGERVVLPVEATVFQGKAALRVAREEEF